MSTKFIQQGFQPILPLASALAISTPKSYQRTHCRQKVTQNSEVTTE
ncbi:hypothetical protein [Synechocystis sp. PCC 7509]|nr:hypothetical protein [Synechocystis sp. PCC 7509]